MGRNALRRAVLLMAGATALGAPGAPASLAACQRVSELSAHFTQTYPTGGVTETFAGDEAEGVLQRLLRPGAGPAVSFLYSGDGPVTGKRGRYLYLVHDDANCVLARDWIDGETYDWVTGPP